MKKINTKIIDLGSLKLDVKSGKSLNEETLNVINFPPPPFGVG
jgi:hypothetical protein